MKATASQVITTYANNDYATVGDRTELLDLLGLDPFGEDDRELGVQFVYCGVHLVTHAAGECAAGNEHKIPLAAMTPEDAHIEAQIRIAFCPVEIY